MVFADLPSQHADDVSLLTAIGQAVFDEQSKGDPPKSETWILAQNMYALLKTARKEKVESTIFTAFEREKRGRYEGGTYQDETRKTNKTSSEKTAWTSYFKDALSFHQKDKADVVTDTGIRLLGQNVDDDEQLKILARLGLSAELKQNVPEAHVNQAFNKTTRTDSKLDILKAIIERVKKLLGGTTTGASGSPDSTKLSHNQLLVDAVGGSDVEINSDKLIKAMRKLPEGHILPSQVAFKLMGLIQPEIETEFNTQFKFKVERKQGEIQLYLIQQKS